MDSDELLPNNLQTYLRSILPVESDVQMALREHTVEHPYSSMQISPEQGAFLAWIVRAFDIQSIIEVGVFTGYSTLCMAQALHESGSIIACDKNADWVAHGIPFWEQAGIRHKIDFLYIPSHKEIYPHGPSKKIKINTFAKKLCGKNRPGHFEAVVDVICRFIKIIKPAKIYLGKKDMQQLKIVEDYINRKLYHDTKVYTNLSSTHITDEQLEHVSIYDIQKDDLDLAKAYIQACIWKRQQRF